MVFDIAHVPFSRFGRFLTLSVIEGGLYLRSVRGGDLRPSLGRLCRIGFATADGASVEARFTLTPDRLLAETSGGSVEFAIGMGERLHLRGRGLTVTFAMEGARYDYAYLTPQGDHCLVAAYENTRLLPRVTSGNIAVTGNWRRDRADDVAAVFSGGFEGTIDLFTAIAPPSDPSGFDAAREEAAADFAAWLAHAPKGGTEIARRLAAYLLWSNTVPAAGILTRPAIYMSKNAMINVWSWDNAFSALGVACMNPDLAFDQFAVIFDHQHPSGLLPDFVNDREASFAFTKPPAHGWAILRLTDAFPALFTTNQRARLADWLARQLDYWLTHARKDPQSLPAYFHGNDSGWDNASFFAEGGPVITPDLPTFLILTCDCLARLQPDRADHWQAQGDRLFNLLTRSLWSGQRFGTRLLSDPTRLRHDESLIGFMPLLLGARLPRAMAQAMIARLTSGGWLTRWGAATEDPQSPLYESDGYWRGPIWAPTTMLIWDGLIRQGEIALAHTLARRFVTLCETSGMAENFDALAGTPLRDRAFAWTSAVYLWLAAWLEGADLGDGDRR